MTAHWPLPSQLLAEVILLLGSRPLGRWLLKLLPSQLLNCRLLQLSHIRQPLVNFAPLELEFRQCNRWCLMALDLLRLCHLVLPLLASLCSCSSCCNRHPWCAIGSPWCF